MNTATVYSDNYMEEQNLTLIWFIDNDNDLTFLQSFIDVVLDNACNDILYLLHH